MTEQLNIHTHMYIMYILLLSRFSRVRLCATPETAAHQAPLSLGFSRQEHWSGLPFPSPMHESEKWKEVAQSCPTLSDPMDWGPPSSCVHGIFQARVLEWGAIAFSIYYVYNKYIIHICICIYSYLHKTWQICIKCIMYFYNTHLVEYVIHICIIYYIICSISYTTYYVILLKINYKNK